MNCTTEITTIAAFISHIEAKCQRDYTLFRGQPKQAKNRPLLPPIGRKSFTPRRSLATSEREMLSEFKAIALPFLQFTPSHQLEWLAVAQHHGMSTRLLDWTTNPLAALWFAIRSAANDRTDAEVWYFAPEKRDHVSAEATASPLTVSRCLVYRPAHIAARIVRQAGWFTLHPIGDDGEFVSLNRAADFSSRLWCLRVPRNAFRDMRYSLDRYGAHEATFLPDLPGAAAYVDWCHRLLPDETKKAGQKHRRRSPRSLPDTSARNAR